VVLESAKRSANTKEYSSTVNRVTLKRLSQQRKSMTEAHAHPPAKSPPWEEHAIAYFQKRCKKQEEKLNGLSSPEYKSQHESVNTEIQSLAETNGWQLKKGYKTYIQELPAKYTFSTVQNYHRDGKSAREICDLIRANFSLILR
jgi:hypothetical protein